MFPNELIYNNFINLQTFNDSIGAKKKKNTSALSQKQVTVKLGRMKHTSFPVIKRPTVLNRKCKKMF